MQDSVKINSANLKVGKVNSSLQQIIGSKSARKSSGLIWFKNGPMSKHHNWLTQSKKVRKMIGPILPS